MVNGFWVFLYFTVVPFSTMLFVELQYIHYTALKYCSVALSCNSACCSSHLPLSFPNILPGSAHTYCVHISAQCINSKSFFNTWWCLNVFKYHLPGLKEPGSYRKYLNAYHPAKIDWSTRVSNIFLLGVRFLGTVFAHTFHMPRLLHIYLPVCPHTGAMFKFNLLLVNLSHIMRDSHCFSIFSSVFEIQGLPDQGKISVAFSQVLHKTSVL